jgi:hypothetical protein
MRKCERVYFAVPTHSGSISVQTAATLMKFYRVAADKLEVQVAFHSGALIGDLRNLIVAEFLLSGFDILFMLDSDQGLDAELIMRMIDTGYPVTGVIYPRRSFAWPLVKNNETTENGTQRVVTQAMRFVGEPIADDKGEFQIVNGFARASVVGAGILLIRRTAIDQLMLKYPELAGTGFHVVQNGDPRAAHNWGFFNQIRVPDGGYNLSEDSSFCQRWRIGCGGDIWAEVVTDTEHVGPNIYKGNFADYLTAHRPLPSPSQSSDASQKAT